MINPFKEINWNPDVREKRKFALSLIVGCPVLAVLMLLAGFLRGAWNPNPPIIFAVIGASIGVLLWTIPQLARPLYVMVYAVSCSIGIIVSNALLIFFFFTIITLAALALKIFGRVPLKKRPDATRNSYWKRLDPVREVTQYYRQY